MCDLLCRPVVTRDMLGPSNIPFLLEVTGQKKYTEFSVITYKGLFYFEATIKKSQPMENWMCVALWASRCLE